MSQNADYGRVGYSLPLGVDPRCQGFDTKPGVIYHAHDLPRCREEAYGVVDGRFFCERHLKAWLEAHPTQIDSSGVEQ